jgi:hypothetical protein
VAREGIPAGLVATSVFQRLALGEMASLGVSGLPLLVIDHPLGGERPEAVLRRAHQAVDQIASLLSAS